MANQDREFLEELRMAMRLVLMFVAAACLILVASTQLMKAKVERTVFVERCAIDLIVMNDNYDRQTPEALPEATAWCSDFADRGGRP